MKDNTRNVKIRSTPATTSWQPWPDLCIICCNGFVNTRVQCKWMGDRHTVVGNEQKSPYVNRVYIQARVKLLFTQGSVPPAVKQFKGETFYRLPPSSLHLSSTLFLFTDLPQRGVTVINGYLYDFLGFSWSCLKLSALNLLRFLGEYDRCAHTQAG